MRLFGNRKSKVSDLANLYPLIVPSTYIESGAWDLPHLPLTPADLILTWVILHPGQTMIYVTADQIREWKKDGVHWRDVALNNMRRDTGNNPATHEKRDANGLVQWIAMMQPDGLGSSRVLMANELRNLFPEGYQVAIPERSVGLALSANASSEHQASFLDLVQNCQRDGTVPMVSRLLDPTDVIPV